MTVNVESHLNRGVPHLGLDIFQVLSLLDLETPIGVPQIVKSNLAEVCGTDRINEKGRRLTTKAQRKARARDQGLGAGKRQSGDE